MAAIDIRKHHLEYAGQMLRVFAVRIDGQLISDTFQVFDASAPSITSHICEECYAATQGQMISCSAPNIAVRKHADTVYWFVADREVVRPLVPNAPLSFVWSFPAENYESQLDSSSSGLPDFSVADIHLILNRSTIFSRKLGLFTIPDIDGDPQGQLLLDVIARSVAADDLAICPAPEEFCTIRIGIESEGIPEAVIDAGLSSQGYAVRFVTNPSFPLWLTTSQFTCTLMQSLIV